jgi:hypothetical protein
MTAPAPTEMTAVERDAFELAASLSIAAFVDVRLVRIFRQELHPGLPASTEAALWFGPLVSRASGELLLLDEDQLPALRRRLLDRPPPHRAHARNARRLLEQVRAVDGAGRYLRAEERLIWLGLRGATGRVINGALREVLTDLRDATIGSRPDPRLVDDIARWAARALPALPPAVLAYSDAARFLAAFASQRAGQPVGGPPDAGAARLLEQISPDQEPVEVGARLAGGQLELSCPPVPEAHRLTSPGADLVFLDLVAPRPLSEPLPWLDGDGVRSAEFDHRPGVLVVERPATGLARPVGGFLARHGFAVSYQGAAELDAALLADESSALAVFDSQREIDPFVPQRVLRALREAEVPTVIIDATTVDRALASDDTTTADAVPGERAEARANLLDAVALLLAAQRPRAVAAVPRPGFVTVPVEGPVWIRAAGEPWHVLAPALPTGVLPLDADGPRGIGPFSFLGVIDVTPLGPIYLTRAWEGRLAAVKVAASGPAEAFADNLRAAAGRWAHIDTPLVARLVRAEPDHDPPYCVAEFAEGDRIDALDADLSWTAERRLRFAYQLAQALAAVHAAGLVHGHLNAGAVRVDDGQVRLVRMHSAGVAGGPPPRDDAESRPHYRPEGVRRGPLDPAADIYGWATLVSPRTSGGSRRSPVRPATGIDIIDALLAEALDTVPEKRPSAQDLVAGLAPVAEELPETDPRPEDPAHVDAEAWRGRVGWTSVLPPTPLEAPIVDVREPALISRDAPGPMGAPVLAELPAGLRRPDVAVGRPSRLRLPAGGGDGQGAVRPVQLSSADRGLLIDVLAGIFPDQVSASQFLSRIGIPYHAMPSWQVTNALAFWSTVVQYLDNGLIAAPYETLLTAALRLYPGSGALRSLADRYLGPADAEAGQGRRDRIFISRGEEDAGSAHELYGQLRQDGFAPWLDDLDILPGENFQAAAERAREDSAAFLVLLSRRTSIAISSRSAEMSLAGIADRAETIVVRLELCEIPSALGDATLVDLFSEGGYRRLTRLLRRRLPPS